MIERKMNRPGRLMCALYALLAAALLSSCGVLESVRTVTYPPDFNYLSDDQLASTMFKLGNRLVALTRATDEQGLEPSSRQRRVVAILADMEEIADELGPAHWPSNHPKITRNVDAFRSDLIAARVAAERQPPNYFLAGSTAATCMHCHGRGVGG